MFDVDFHWQNMSLKEFFDFEEKYEPHRLSSSYSIYSKTDRLIMDIRSIIFEEY